jgi:hypothetical protein
MAKTDPEYEKCMSAAQLHQRLLASMLHQSLPKEEDPGVMVTSIHRFSTPVYISLSKDHNMPSIPLKRFRDRPLEPLSVPSMVFETRKLSDSPAMKVKLEDIRTCLFESGELTSTERKQLEDNPHMSPVRLRFMLLEVEHRIAEKRDARRSGSSRME